MLLFSMNVGFGTVHAIPAVAAAAVAKVMKIERLSPDRA